MKKKLLLVGLGVSALMFLIIFGLILFSLRGAERKGLSETDSEEGLSEVVFDKNVWLENEDKSEFPGQESDGKTMTDDVQKEDAQKNDPEDEGKSSFYIQDLAFKRISAKQIDISWQGVPQDGINGYRLERSKVLDGQPTGEWTPVADCEADRGLEEEYVLTDMLDSKEPVQYAYRVIPEWDGTEQCAVTDFEPVPTILASNVLVCIDPGHYAGKESVPEDAPYPYTEGDYTIKIAWSLKDILYKEYGIDSFLTREGDDITISDYTNEELDSKHISLRGEYAGTRDSNLFLSLHTNSNIDDANGFPTFEQPVSITKTLVIANQVAMQSKDVLDIANAIGVNLSRINYEYGIANTPDFQECKVGTIEELTGDLNNGLNQKGRVVYRLKKNGKEDYYGVLRGATNIKMPGLIIEHGYHSVPEFRKLAAESRIYEDWAKADAYGIAYGYGFVTNKRMEE